MLASRTAAMPRRSTSLRVIVDVDDDSAEWTDVDLMAVTFTSLSRSVSAVSVALSAPEIANAVIVSDIFFKFAVFNQVRHRVYLSASL